MRKRTLLLLSVLILGLLTPGGPALAKRRHVKEKHVATLVGIISLTEDAKFAGVVKAKEDRLCKRDRRVHIDRDGIEIAAVTSDHRGHWTVTTGSPLARGDRVIARVDEREIQKSRFHRTVCDSSVSGIVAIHQLDVKVTGSGSVSSAPDGIDACTASAPAASCSSLFTATGTALAAMPTPGNRFEEWDHVCSQTSTTPRCAVPMDQDYLIATNTEADATFAPGPGGTPPPATCPVDPAVCDPLG